MNPKVAVALATLQHSETFIKAIQAGQDKCPLAYPPQYAEAIDKLKTSVELAEREYKEQGSTTIPVDRYLGDIAEALNLIMNLDVNVKALHQCAWAAFQAGKATNDLLVKVAHAAREAGAGPEVDGVLEAAKQRMIEQITQGIPRA